jgi:Mg/Co/Ni transporter MgtE
VITCGLDTPAADVAGHLDGYELAVVVHRGVVVGIVKEKELDAHSERLVGELMEEGPSTLRADLPLEELAPRLAELDGGTALVTTPEGRLIGLVGDAATRPQ